MPGRICTTAAVIALDRATVPVSLAQLLGDADGLLAQVDPRKVELIKKELSLSKEGPAKLAAIVDGGTFLLSTLDSVLPQTTSIIKTSRVVLTLASDKNAGLAATANRTQPHAVRGGPNAGRLPAADRTDAAHAVGASTTCSPTIPTPWCSCWAAWPPCRSCSTCGCRR